MKFSSVKIERLLGVPTNPQPNQFYLVEYAGQTEFYLSNSKGELFLLNSTAGGGMDQLSDDLTPELGGDLELAGYDVIGTLDNSTFILDGGLL